MEIEKRIEELNEKLMLKGVGLDKLDNKDLTEVQIAFIKTFSPEKVFIVYGTLAPNRPNHYKIEHIQGKWREGTIKGKLENKGWGAELGYYGFKHCTEDEQQNIKVYVLFSEHLKDNWTRLDEFEGTGYLRILCKFELENGEIGVGNIYAINE